MHMWLRIKKKKPTNNNQLTDLLEFQTHDKAKNPLRN